MPGFLEFASANAAAALSAAVALGVAAGAGVTAATLAWARRRAGGRLHQRLDAANSQIDELKGRDTLTGLVTRVEFETRLDLLAGTSDRGEGALALIYVGLDNFRTINDGYGHRVGDGVLVEVGRRLAGIVGGRPLACRVGGDEFALAVPGPDAGRDNRATAVAEQVLAAMQQPFEVEGLDLRLTASAGIAAYPEHASRPRLIANAALAMRSVKLAGGSGYSHFHPSMGADVREQAELVQDLRQAIEGRQLTLVYQPKVDAKSLQITAAEALLRWHHPRLGYISPEVFVRLAERHGLIGSIGRWVIEEACRQAAAWREQGLRMRIAVNISGAQLRGEHLVENIAASLARHRIPPGRLTCEITESVAMEDTTQTRAAFERLRKAGLHVSIDDFGTGHSSLAILRRLPAAELKIDRAFITDLVSSEHARSIAQAVVQMAHTLGLRVVAEGVETPGQRDILVEMGCDELQGYLFAKPMGAAALAMWAHDDHDGSEKTPEFRPSLFEMTRPADLD